MDDELISAVRAVAFASRSLERALEQMTLPQYRVLTLIINSPERASRIARGADVTRPSLTGLLDGLVAKGWVARSEVDGDRRGVSLAITPAGERAYTEAQAAMAAGIKDLLDGADRKTARRALDGLVALHEALVARRDRSAA
ncbi:MAG TPA: MarR family transcriptional regulator [Acidimicrobiales bacterium]|nr:MarR family transcriptional regulator [Acidimicrobiales bacterium]